MPALAPSRRYSLVERIGLTALYKAKAFGAAGGVSAPHGFVTAAFPRLRDDGLVGVEIGNAPENQGKRFYYLTTKGKREAYRVTKQAES